MLARRGWLETQWPTPANAAGQPFRLTVTGQSEPGNALLQPYIENLKVSVSTRLRTVDRAQYKQRLDQFDFLARDPDDASTRPSARLEQWQYFHSSQVGIKGSKKFPSGTPIRWSITCSKQLLARTRGRAGRRRQGSTVLPLQHRTAPNWYLNYHAWPTSQPVGLCHYAPYNSGPERMVAEVFEKDQ